METARYVAWRAEYHSRILKLNYSKSKPEHGGIRRFDGYTQVAEELGRDVSWVSLQVLLTKLADPVQVLIDGKEVG